MVIITIVPKYKERHIEENLSFISFFEDGITLIT